MRQWRERIPFPAEVFHELAGQFDRIPFDTVDAGDAELFDAREQMMQAVAEFVEQRDDFVVSEERRLLLAVHFADGRCEIAIKVSYRRLDAATNPPPRDRVVHPGAAALRGTRIQIE